MIPDDVEKLKEQIHAILERIEKASSTEASAAADPDQNLIYLICDKEDREDVLPLRKLLKDRGYDVKIPLFAGAAAEVDAKQRDMLTRCRAALIFYGKGDEGWKNAIDGDLMKSKAYRADKPPFKQLTYLAPPVTEEKREMLELQEPNLIDGLEGFSQSAIEALAQMLQKA